MAEPAGDRPKSSRDLLGLFAFIILCLAVSGGGGAITATSVDTWYQALEKPPLIRQIGYSRPFGPHFIS